MIDIHGPTYTYSGEILSSPEIILVRDHHYDSYKHCYHVEKLLENSLCDPQQHLLIFDHVTVQEGLTKYPYVCLPMFLARENKEFIHQNIQPDWSRKTSTFNFMINKPRPNRRRLLALIEQHKLTNYCHSLAWKTNDINNIPVTDYVFGPEVVMDQGVCNGSFKNAHTYNKLLQKTVFEPSCISLITEPAYYEKETIVTEKTLMALYAGTIPIWVGGWRIADYMASMGFDVFDDIVDHSYQSEPDPELRCDYAVKRNLELLRNFDLASDSIELTRLQHNYDLLQQNVFLKDVLEKTQQSELQSIVAQELF
jgi:hypothetical protein